MPTDDLSEDRDPRVYLASERTLLAWVRTGLAMMGFGFVVARFGLFLHEIAAVEHLPPPSHTRLSLWGGTALVVLGVVVNIVAAWEHARFIQRFNRGQALRARPISMGVIISLVLAVLGLGICVYLLTMR